MFVCCHLRPPCPHNPLSWSDDHRPDDHRIAEGAASAIKGTSHFLFMLDQAGRRQGVVDFHYAGRLDDALTQGKRRSAGPIVDANFREDVAYMVDDGVLADDERL